jgi:hypothetical protein
MSVCVLYLNTSQGNVCYALWYLGGVVYIKGSPYHPQSQGVLERQNSPYKRKVYIGVPVVLCR